MNRSEAYILLNQYLTNVNLIKHSLAAEATMKALYRHLTSKSEQNEKDEEMWGIAGLLHDIDYEVAQKEDSLNMHGMLLFERGEIKLPQAIENAIRAHNYPMTKHTPKTQMDWAITTCDQLTGLITACALVKPDKLLSEVTPEGIKKKFGQKAFAAGADREMISKCEAELGIPLDEFIKITLTAMQEIHNQLGL